MTMRKRLATCGAALSGLLVTGLLLHAQEEKLSVNDLPSAVRKAVRKKFPEAKYRGAAKEVEGRTTTYEVMLTVDGRAVDMALKADGTILEIEKEVAVDRLPKAVRKGLAARYPGAKVQKAEELIKGEDGEPLYEIVIQTEVVFTAKGKAVQAAAKEEDDDDEKPSAKARKKQKKEDDDDEDEEREAKRKKRDRD
jgi:hypothetical protein